MIRALKTTDLKGLNKISPPDWNFNLEHFIQGYLSTDFFYAFVLIQDDKIVGTGNIFLKESIAWLANIIIDENYRGRGLGFKMTKFLVDFIEKKGCETQLLIATELGEPVYKKIGFEKMTDYQCFDSEIDMDYVCPNSIRGLEYSDIENAAKLDMEANAENRMHLLENYYKTGFGYFNNENELLGFYLPDFGRGLVLSRDEQAGIELLKLKHSKKGKRTMLPNDNKVGIDFLEKSGFKKGNKCSRMILGKENKWNPNFIYSYGSGYCG